MLGVGPIVHGVAHGYAVAMPFAKIGFDCQALRAQSRGIVRCVGGWGIAPAAEMALAFTLEV